MAAINFAIPFVSFVLVDNPATFKFVRGILGDWVASAEGLPTMSGLALHALVFIVLVGFLMVLLNKKTSGYGGTKIKGQACDGSNQCYHTCYTGKCT